MLPEPSWQQFVIEALQAATHPDYPSQYLARREHLDGWRCHGSPLWCTSNACCARGLLGWPACAGAGKQRAVCNPFGTDNASERVLGEAHGPTLVGKLSPVQRKCHYASKHELRGCTVALLLYGEAFRQPVPSTFFDGTTWKRQTLCGETAIAPQREATESYTEHVAKPLEASGAVVDILFTFTRCADEPKTHRMRERLARWLGDERVAGWWEITSTSAADAIVKAYVLLAWAMGRRGDWYDFVLHAKHDIYQQVPLSTWPPTTVIRPAAGHSLTHSNFANMSLDHDVSLNLSRVLLESPCPQCGFSCSCGLGIPLDGQCRVCNNDHMAWSPRRLLPMVMGAAMQGHHEHVFMRKLLVDDADLGWLFPPTCTGAFCIDLIRDQFRSYRPSRSGPEQGRGRS